MSQSSIIFGALFIGFLVYVTMKGQLKAYAAVFTGSVQTGGNLTDPIASTPNPAPSSSTNLVTGNPNDQIGTFLTSIGVGGLLSQQ